jgi:primosomal protein N' (replication factor Y)
LVSAIARVEPVTTARSLRGPFDYRLPEELAQVEVGATLVVPFGRRDVLGVVVGLAEQTEVDHARLVEPRRRVEPGLPAELVELAAWIAREYCSTFARALALVLPPGASQEARRAAPARPRGARRRPAPARDARQAAPHLNNAQRAALAPIQEAIGANEPERFLLHGVTGSGKTEVYLRAAQAALERGRSAIVLVPEIALTAQLVRRVVDRLGDTVAVLHSRLTPAQRRDEWARLRSGEACVCVGPRSAVFAPVDDLGLVVIDEEHDASYKHEGDPRYDARRVAQRRAEASRAVLVAGSATPRPESYHSWRRVTLGERVDGRALPPVEVLDMRGARRALHPVTARALADVSSARSKAIVLLNRRGWSNFLACRGCGRAWECPACDVVLVLHRAESMLSCHHCGHRERVPERCVDCGSVSIGRHGAGTERLAHELSEALGDDGFPVVRLDTDVAGRAGGADALLARFAAAPAGVLVGTQMVAKGHDFPDVTLAVILDADATLRFPDFRAEERTFALVAQLGGRAGRGPGGGRVLVQTLAPNAPSIRYASRHDSDGFLARELARREALGYPPFSDLIRVVCASRAPDAADAAASALADHVGADIGGSGRLLGPAPLFRLRGRERSQLVVKAARRDAAIAAVGDAVASVASARAHRGVTFSVDVDPQ